MINKHLFWSHYRINNILRQHLRKKKPSITDFILFDNINFVEVKQQINVDTVNIYSRKTVCRKVMVPEIKYLKQCFLICF